MITLNVYKKDNKKEIEKTHSVQGYDLMLGTVEEFMQIIDIDKLGDSVELAKMVVKGYGQIRPLLLDVFPELTEEELNRTKVTEVVQTIIQIAMAIGESLKELGTKNVVRA